MKNRTNKTYLDVFHSELVKGASFTEQNEFPIIKPTYFVPDKAVPFDKASKSKVYSQWVHFYIDDYRFERIWNNPKQYLPMLQRFDGVITPDFSVYRDMPIAMQIWNTYRNRALAYWLQSNGVAIIPNINWGDKRSYDFCFEGIAEGCNVAVSSNGCLRDRNDRLFYNNGLSAMMDILKPSGIIHYCTAPDDIWRTYRKHLREMKVIDHYHRTVRKKAVA